MSTNAKIIKEQGGSVLNVASGGSLNVQSGGAFFIGNVQFISAASNEGPGGLPVSASPGAIFIRSDGSVSNLYVNVSSGTAGSVWKSASIFS